MKTPFLVCYISVSWWIWFALPFWRVLRGWLHGPAMARGWAESFLFGLLTLLGLPAIARLVGGKRAEDFFLDFLPEAKSLVPIIVFGWLPPLLAGVLAFFVRAFLSKYLPAVLQKINPKVAAHPDQINRQ